MAITDFIDKFGGWTESYFFYNDQIELRYDPKDHVYLLVTDQGLEKVDGVTTVVHVIDKSEALVPWGCKMMYQKILRNVRTVEREVAQPDGPPQMATYVLPMTFEEFDKLIHDGKSAHTEKLEEAGEIGHTAHAWIEDYIKLKIAQQQPMSLEDAQALEGKLNTHLANMPILTIDNGPDQDKTFDERPKNCCVAALEWMKRHNVRWHSTERKIYSRRYKYAGTMDGLCTCDSCDDPKCCPVPFKDKLTVADWKTSNYLYLEYLYQTAAYMQAYNEEMAGAILAPATDRWVIRLGKEDGEFEPWHCDATTTENDTQGFLDCLDLVRRVKATQNRISERKADLRAALKAERDAAREAKEELERAQRAEAKAKKQQERVEALKLACAASKKYKGSRKPSCKTGEGGGPCEACARIYMYAQQAKRGDDTIAAAPLKEDTCQLADGTKTEASKSTSSDNGSKTQSAESVNRLMAVLVRKEHTPILLPSTTPDTQPQPTNPPCDGEHGGQQCSFGCWLGEAPIGSRYEDLHPQLLLPAPK